MSTATCEDGSEVTGVPRPSDDDARSDSVRREVWPSVAAICAYILLGVTAYRPVLPDISGKLFSNASDFTQSVWFIGWVPHALAHGLNPFFSNAMYSPTGVNLADNTASPFLGLLTAPLALVWSPLVVGNLLLVLSMPISAAAAFVVLRKWQVWWPAAALGGLVYGFSPYMVGQGLGHVEMMFVPLPPFIVMTVVSILQRQGSERRLGIQLGLLIAVQYLILPEVLASVAVFTFVAVFCVALRHPSAVREMAPFCRGVLNDRPPLTTRPSSAEPCPNPKAWISTASPRSTSTVTTRRSMKSRHFCGATSRCCSICPRGRLGRSARTRDFSCLITQFRRPTFCSSIQTASLSRAANCGWHFPMPSTCSGSSRNAFCAVRIPRSEG